MCCLPGVGQGWGAVNLPESKSCCDLTCEHMGFCPTAQHLPAGLKGLGHPLSQGAAPWTLPSTYLAPAATVASAWLCPVMDTLQPSPGAPECVCVERVAGPISLWVSGVQKPALLWGGSRLCRLLMPALSLAEWTVAHPHGSAGRSRGLCAAPAAVQC